MIDYTSVYVNKYMAKECSLEEAYAQCSSELLKLRLVSDRKKPYIENLENQEKFLSSIIIRNFMHSKGYRIDDSDANNVCWVKKEDIE